MVNSVKKVNENIYKVDSYVDAQNGFGRAVRTNFECEMKYDNGHWKMLNIDIE